MTLPDDTQRYPVAGKVADHPARAASAARGVGIRFRREILLC
jgi:Tfp pilus assembly protein PilZ